MDLALAANDNESLINQLSFQPPPIASYARERRLVQIQPQGANTFSPNGNQVMTFSLSSNESWLDPSSLRLHFRINNTAAAMAFNDLAPTSGCHCFFQQLRVLVNGTEIERVDDYHRVHELFRVVLNTPQSQVEQAVEDGRVFLAGQYPPVTAGNIPAQTYKSVTLTPLSGLLTCGKYLPLRFMNSLVLEWQLARTDDALLPGQANRLSRFFELTQCELQYSTVRLDSALEAGFASMMLSGRALQINLRSIVSQASIIPERATEHQATVVRALSRICGVFVTFQGRAPNHEIMRFHNPSAVVGEERLLEWSVAIGSKQWPEMRPCNSTAATMSLLKQTLGIYDQSVACTSITPVTYNDDRYVIGVPTSTIPGQAFSGISTRSGDLLSVLIRGMGAGGAGEAQKLYITLVAEFILELKESGAVLLE